MSPKTAIASLVLLFGSAALPGQISSAAPPKTEAPAKLSSISATAYIDPSSLHLDLLLPPAPSRETTTTVSELAALHQIEAERTPAEITQAQADDREEDIFIFKTVLGPNFNAENLPATAALSSRVHAEEGAASGLLKKFYHRPRPYQADSTLHPVCQLSSQPTSYPSGHALSGYLLAYTLVQMVPEKKQEIFNRTEQYVRNRMVCGVHYASDIVASRDAAYAIFGSLAATPAFQQDLAAAREETRHKLGLSALPSQP
jgi:acid phosphatase (class A)